jgi:hypothetical protein
MTAMLLAVMLLAGAPDLVLAELPDRLRESWSSLLEGGNMAAPPGSDTGEADADKSSSAKAKEKDDQGSRAEPDRPTGDKGSGRERDDQGSGRSDTDRGGSGGPDTVAAPDTGNRLPDTEEEAPDTEEPGPEGEQAPEEQGAGTGGQDGSGGDQGERIGDAPDRREHMARPEEEPQVAVPVEPEADNRPPPVPAVSVNTLTIRLSGYGAYVTVVADGKAAGGCEQPGNADKECSLHVPHGSTVVLTAPLEIADWRQGPCSGRRPSCEFVIKDNTTVGMHINVPG